MKHLYSAVSVFKNEFLLKDVCVCLGSYITAIELLLCRLRGDLVGIVIISDAKQ